MEYFHLIAEILVGIVCDRVVPARGQVLEIGSGTGSYCIELARRGFKVWGMDFSQSMVTKARDRALGDDLAAMFLVGDVDRAIPFHNKAFDMVLSIDSWEFFFNPLHVLHEVSRVLHDKGQFLIVTPNPYAAPLIIAMEKIGLKKLAPAFALFNSFPACIRKYAQEANFLIHSHQWLHYWLAQMFVLEKAGESL